MKCYLLSKIVELVRPRSPIDELTSKYSCAQLCIMCQSTSKCRSADVPTTRVFLQAVQKSFSQKEL